MIQAKPLFAFFLCIGVLSVVHIALRTDTTRLPIALLSTVEPLTVDSQTTDDPETMCGRMVVLTASVTEVTHSTPYPLLLPLTARAWLAAGFRPVIVLAVFRPDEWQNSALGMLLMADLRLIEGSFIFILPSPTPFIEVALAQTVRLFITAVLPCSDGYLRVSDADMIVYQGEPFHTEDVEGVHVYNGDCCRPQLPMHSIGMSVRLWKDLFMPMLNLTTPVTLSQLSSALTQLLVNEGINLNSPMQFGKEHVWFIDQIYAGRVIRNYASSPMLHRIHVGDVYSDGVVESHEHKIVVSQLPQLQERIEMSSLRTAAAFRDWSWTEWCQRAIPVLLDPTKYIVSKTGFTCPIQTHTPSILDSSSQVWIHVDRELSSVEGRDIYYPYYTSDFIFDNLVHWQLADKSVFEFGGGRSSIWWASRVRSLTVIDDKSEYLCFIDSELRSLKSMRADVTLFKYDAGCKACVLDSFAKLNQSFDIIVIDGEPTEYRCDMLMAALSYLKKPNGIIIADNWDQPEVWHNPPCVSVIENAYGVGVQKFKHSARFGKDAHTNGWTTMFFRPTGTIGN